MSYVMLNCFTYLIILNPVTVFLFFNICLLFYLAFEKTVSVYAKHPSEKLVSDVLSLVVLPY